ncbi:MAG TPA: hypothetical protein VMU28_13330 [Terriglobales bacterium]|nr:hypothetical protein [Terriglobales bacterium]
MRGDCGYAFSMIAAFIFAGRNQAPPPWWFIFLAFFGTWFFVMFFISRVGGWSRLAESYRTEQPFLGNLIRFQAAQLRNRTNYNGCMNFGGDPAGLYMVPMVPFRMFHPPLLIPWEEITTRPVKLWRFWNFIELRFQRSPEIPVKIKQALAEKLVQASGGRLQLQSTALTTM